LKPHMLISELSMATFLMVAVFLFSCTSRTKDSSAYSPKFQQYYVQGEILYKKYCANCHQLTGKGLGRLYPPVDQSDFMDRNFEEVICIIKYGKQGSLLVNGVDYNMTMKDNPGLTELEVAEIATYIYNTWSNQKGLVDVRDVSPILSTCNN
jgi:cytochrome c551